jgi:hypothetical protein
MAEADWEQLGEKKKTEKEPSEVRAGLGKNLHAGQTIGIRA